MFSTCRDVLPRRDTLDEVKRLMQEGIEFHLQGMREDGDPIPEPTTLVDYVEAPAVYFEEVLQSK